MLPIIEVPQTIASGMTKYRDVFCREEGFEHVSRYVTGLVISPNKTLQGIYDLQVWDRDAPSRRAMYDTTWKVGRSYGIIIRSGRCLLVICLRVS